ncbi:MAG TPA: SMP-30/gluconolactonase/LRE family protein [Blastocatellia bacterium]|nr:SMP-30/gluconolactonase/LRE family protein [Blastocatellia bacterium]
MKPQGSRSRPQAPDFSSSSGPPRPRRARAVVISSAVLAAIALLAFFWLLRPRPPMPFVAVMTVGGPGLKIANSTLPDLFGVAVDDKGRVFFSDGTGDSVRRIDADGSLKTIASDLDTPSGLAFERGGRLGDGSLIVANTGGHTIVRIDIGTGRSNLVAGAPGQSGFADGAADQARFNGAVGVAVNKDGVIFVADTYNDRIRAIEDGRVRTIAGGGEPGFRDGRGAEARFDTPCGIAVGADGSLLVADTGNHRIRRVALDGEVTTIAGAGEPEDRDGGLAEAAFGEPTGIAARRDGMIFVTCAAWSSVRMIDLNGRVVTTVVRGGFPGGLADGAVAKAKLNRPSSLAFASNDALVLADSNNGLIRAVVPEGASFGFRSEPGAAIIKASDVRDAVPPRWPYDPPEAKRDIAGTFGEIRGEMLPDHDAWFHNGLDVPGAYGETARAIFSERVTLPIAVEGAGSGRERLRLPLIGYIHLRVGRDRSDQPTGDFPNGAITFRRDERGRVVGVRLRRGTRINAGDAIGALNGLNHVHLIAGPAGEESNPLAALRLPGLSDTIAPTIESVAITNELGESLFDSAKTARGSKTCSINGRARVIVRAYDQIDGSPRRRRLGVYRLGYQLLRADGSPEAGFEQPRYNVVFDRLPAHHDMIKLAYAEGSQSGYEGLTVFGYIVTNVARGGLTREEFLDASQLAPGNYTLRVFAEDFFGNQARRDTSIIVTNAK